jgi:UDP-N-acetylmuramate dehydrogenase
VNLLQLENEIGALPGLMLRRGVSAQAATTLAIGGPISLLIEPKSANVLSRLLALLERQGAEYRVLGAGSNLLLPDEGVSLPVIHLGREFTACRLFADRPDEKDLLLWTKEPTDSAVGPDSPVINTGDEYWLLALGGMPLMGLSRRLSASGLSGLEFAAGIPGSLAGAAVMNAGAHGSEMSEVLDALLLTSAEPGLRLLAKEDLHCSYRKTEIPPRTIVVGVLLRLRGAEPVLTKERRSACLDYRRMTQPLHLPSAGSVFKNPVPSEEFLCRFAARFEGQMPSAGKLLEEVGLKGFGFGGLAFSEMHANWLVKIKSDGRTSDALCLINEAKKRVFSEFGILLELEIKFWGEA